MRRIIAALSPLAPLALASGCGLMSATYTPQDPAKLRATNEFACDYDQVVATARPDLGPFTEDVNACGHEARYTCLPYGRYGTGRACAREPTD
jgi:hypothetical protein